MMQENGKLDKPILIAGAGRNKATDDVADKASEAAIKAAIDTARGKIEKNVLDPAGIWVAAHDAEESLASLKIPVSERPGAVVYMRPEGPSAKAYKYPQNTIEAQAERKRDSWVLTHVARTIVWPKQPEAEKLLLTPKQRDVAVERGAQAGTLLSRRPSSRNRRCRRSVPLTAVSASAANVLAL